MINAEAMKQRNVISCECGCVFPCNLSNCSYDVMNKDGKLSAVCIICPECGRKHFCSPEFVSRSNELPEVNATKITTVMSSSLDKYSFEEIKQLAENGKICAGMFKTITLKDGTEAVVEVLGIKHDNLPSGKKASVTFGFRNLLDTSDKNRDLSYSTANNNCAVGWKILSLREYLNKDFIHLLPDDLVKAIVPVVKYFAAADIRDTRILERTVDKVFLPSESEVFGKVQLAITVEGTQYEWFKDWKNRIKSYSHDDGHGIYGQTWSLRSMMNYHDDSICAINGTGKVCYQEINAPGPVGICPCFAI